MKFSILLDIFFELLAKRILTAGYIAEKHGISVRTVYRYVDLLSTTVPIYVKQGRNGGICMSDSYKLPKGFMTKDEYEAAIEALSAMYAQLPEERFLAAKRKLSAQVKSETRDLTLSGNVGTILVDSGTWGDARKFSDKMRLYEECIRDRLVVEIDYHSRVGERSTRKIEPHVLVFKQNVWYVYAFCRKQKAFRLFRLGRIFSSFVTEERFIKRNVNREDIPLNFWSDETSSIDVTLEVRPSAFADVQDWLGGENLRLEKDVWRVEATLPDDEVLVRKIVELGSGVKVLSPASLQQRVVTLAKELLKQYE